MILKSMLDNDLYKLTMQHAVVSKFPRSRVRYRFINRAGTAFPDGFGEELRRQVHAMSALAMTQDEYDFLSRACYFLPPTYLDFLRGYRYNPSEVGIIQQGPELQVSIEGYWYRTILWEVPLMALISELYFRMTGQAGEDFDQVAQKARAKATRLKMLGVKVADFGTRRRFSAAVHDLVVGEFKNYASGAFMGTSNVYLAMKHDTRPTGTHAHEWFMFHAAKYGFKMANKLALEHWVDVFRGDLGIALSDTFTTDAFFLAFDTKFAKLFDGVRQDSGDPLVFLDKTVAHYKSIRIDPMTKTIIFSDGLDVAAVERIADHARGKIQVSFGIGTHLTNDVGAKPLNMVIKMVDAKAEGREWIPTIKLSDAPGKHSGDAQTIELCKRTLNIP